MKHTFFWIAVAGWAIVSCKVTEPYRRPEATASYRAVSADTTDTLSLATRPWRSFFTDTLLQRYIDQGIRENPDMKIAVERMQAASATARQTRLAFFPEVNSSLSLKQSRLAFPQGFGLVTSATQYDAGLSMAWEADIWGKLRSNRRAALAAWLGTTAARQAVQSRLVADIAGLYYQLLALDSQREILEKTIENRAKDVGSMKDLMASGQVTGADVAQSEAGYAAAVVALPDLKRQVREAENALCLLLAQPAGPVVRGSLKEQAMPDGLSAGLPAQLLQNRPDVQAAELSFRNAFELTNVARTAFYPSLTLTAGGGFSSFDFAQWFTSGGLFANVLGGLTQPVFKRGENRARLAVATARRQEAWWQFTQVLRTAGNEVSDALYALESAKEKYAGREQQLTALSRAVEFNKELLRYSSATNYTDVLLSEQQLLAAQLSRTGDRLQQWQAIISLYRALGGGTH